jgi:fatty-acyl-CoA synthase
VDAHGRSGDADGYVKITDRLKDGIKSGGEWVSSLQLEDLILRHPGVAEVAVIGVPDPKWGERPLALVVAKPGQGVGEAQLRSQLQEFAAEGIIPRYGVPDRIVLVEALPKTSVWKARQEGVTQPVRPISIRDEGGTDS